MGLVLTWLLLRDPPDPLKAGLPWAQKLHQLDLAGAVTLLGALVCLNLVLQWGGIKYPWSDPKVFGCLIGFVLLFVAFLYMQARGKERLVSLQCCKIRTNGIFQLYNSSSHR